MHPASYNTESMNQTDLLDYISGTDKSREKEIEAWLRESPENREQYFLMKELWAHKVAREVSGEERLDKAISGIHSKIQNERMRSRYRRSAAIGWSFASCLLLFIALWTGIPKLGKKPDIVLENTNEAVSLHSLPDGIWLASTFTPKISIPFRMAAAPSSGREPPFPTTTTSIPAAGQ